jgi:predicted short-subunit dehydrogenase-like oxidoreductase (DUF2520 family)
MTKTVTIIGTGNVATHLVQALHKAGIKVDLVIGRSMDSCKSLALSVNARYSSNISSTQITSNLAIIAVSDDAYPEVISQLLLSPSTVVAHTSGSLSIDILSKLPNSHGVFYPLQTFTIGRSVDFSGIPICIEASSEKAMQTIEEIALKLSSKTLQITSLQREQIHLAAIFSSNFVNYLYLCSEELMQDNGLPFELLHPLIAETTSKAIEINPENAQTGPARRNDLRILQKHISMLKSSEMKQLYTFLSEQIIKKYNS